MGINIYLLSLCTRCIVTPSGNLTTILKKKKKAEISSLILWIRKSNLTEAKSLVSSCTVGDSRARTRTQVCLAPKPALMLHYLLACWVPKVLPAFSHNSKVVRPRDHTSNPIGSWPGFCPSLNRPLNYRVVSQVTLAAAATQNDLDAISLPLDQSSVNTAILMLSFLLCSSACCH